MLRYSWRVQAGFKPSELGFPTNVESVLRPRIVINSLSLVVSGMSKNW